MIINIPAIPAFAGDLKADDALSTRAIMEFQYNSINRGGYSIYEQIAKAGMLNAVTAKTVALPHIGYNLGVKT